MENYFGIGLIVLGVLVFVASGLFFLSRRARMKQNLRSVEQYTSYQPQENIPDSGFATFANNSLSMLGMEPTDDNKKLLTELQQAGINSPNAILYYRFSTRILQPIIFVLGAILFGKTLLLNKDQTTAHLLQMLLIAGLMLIIGGFGTRLYISNRRQHRQKILLHSFPEALDLLLVCIESGLGLDAALVRTSTELKFTHPIMAGELDRTRVELAVLNDRTQALKNLGDRTGVQAMRSLVSSLIQTEQFGTSLVDTLRVLSEEQRITRLMNAENKAARIPVLITIPLILCIMPALIMVILGPPIVRVHEQGGIFGPVEHKQR